MSRLLFGVILLAVAMSLGCRRADGTANLTELERVRSGMLDVLLLSPHDAIHRGQDAFVIEFKSASGGNLIDVGNVRASASMPMPGMTMFGNIEVRRTGAPGRYAADSQFDMAGTWRITIEWDGAVGHGSVIFSGTVQ